MKTLQMQLTHNRLPACRLELLVPTKIHWVLVAYKTREFISLNTTSVSIHMLFFVLKKVQVSGGQTQKHLDTINTLHYLSWLWRKRKLGMLLDRHTRIDIYSLSWQYNETRQIFPNTEIAIFQWWYNLTREDKQNDWLWEIRTVCDKLHYAYAEYCKLYTSQQNYSFLQTVYITIQGGCLLFRSLYIFHQPTYTPWHDTMNTDPWKEKAFRVLLKKPIR